MISESFMVSELESPQFLSERQPTLVHSGCTINRDTTDYSQSIFFQLMWSCYVKGMVVLVKEARKA